MQVGLIGSDGEVYKWSEKRIFTVTSYSITYPWNNSQIGIDFYVFGEAPPDAKVDIIVDNTLTFSGESNSYGNFRILVSNLSSGEHTMYAYFPETDTKTDERIIFRPSTVLQNLDHGTAELLDKDIRIRGVTEPNAFVKILISYY